ncbi:hypothetical protein IWW34DRAFT_137866 [Fusarium oxysporum f. sp. albedinis]|nr:hypothetical protein IWW34DRAFT_137866 [Fusarium oxysporum f. sp. albedinis]
MHMTAKASSGRITAAGSMSMIAPGDPTFLPQKTEGYVMLCYVMYIFVRGACMYVCMYVCIFFYVCMCIFRLGGCNEAKSPTGAKDVLS